MRPRWINRQPTTCCIVVDGTQQPLVEFKQVRVLLMLITFCLIAPAATQYLCDHQCMYLPNTSKQQNSTDESCKMHVKLMLTDIADGA